MMLCMRHNTTKAQPEYSEYNIITKRTLFHLLDISSVHV